MMYVEIKKELSFEDLKRECWSGAINTLERIEKENNQEALMYLLEEIFFEKTPTMTELNDFLWFDTDFIYESLEMEEEE